MQEQNREVVTRPMSEAITLTPRGEMEVFDVTKHLSTYLHFTLMWGHITDIPFAKIMVMYVPNEKEMKRRCSIPRMVVIHKSEVTKAFKEFRDTKDVRVVVDKNFPTGNRYMYHKEDLAIFINGFIDNVFDRDIERPVASEEVEADDEQIIL